MENQNVPVELGTEKVGKLLKRYAVPAVIAMTASSLYNMVDSIFIGHGVGALAISGLALTFPLMNLAAAFGTLVGVGAASLLSMLLGQRNYGIAKQVLGNVLIMNIVIGLAFTAVSLLFLDDILYFFGASDDTIGYAREYMSVILAGNVITHSYFGLNSLLRASGHPKKSMVATIFTVLINVVFDYIFIFVFGWGIRGAAIATVLSQVLALGWMIKLFSNKNEFIHFEWKRLKFNPRIAKESLAIGLSPFLMNIAACFVIILINQQLKRYGGDLAIGAYGIVNRIAFLFLMVVMGITQGMQPIAGYNYGAKNYSRVKEVLRLSIYVATLIMTVGFVFGEIFPTQLASIFTTDSQLISHSAKGLRITLIAFPLIGFQSVVSNFFQSIGQVKRAVFLSLSRQLLFLIPLVFVLPLFWAISGVWMSFPISDTAAFIMAAILLINFLKKFKDNG